MMNDEGVLLLWNRRLHLLLLLTSVFAGGVSSAAVTSASADAVCSADDTRQECLNNDSDIVDGKFNEIGADEDCIDENSQCRSWSQDGECENNPGYMLKNCQRSCNVCGAELDSNDDFGVPQLISGSQIYAAPTKLVLSKSVEYMQQILEDPKYEHVHDKCRNNHASCSEWAIGAGCDNNSKYMKKECCPACQSCDYVLEIEEKCGVDPDAKDAIEIGGMDALFERMVRTADISNLEPNVLSRPTKTPELNKDDTYTSTPSCGEDASNPCDVPDGPWVITLENFVTPDEIESLLNWGAKIGYERSQAGDAVVEARTSAHAWCDDECFNDPIVTTVRERIAHVTGVPESNFECLQLLKYLVGQFYKPHIDYIEVHAEQSHGPRLLTFFIYFNSVEKGGGTRFPILDNLTVEPRQGRALIWPSVLDDDLTAEDKRTEHEALPVEKGEKYAANAWIHTRDYQGPFKEGCPS